MQKTTAVLISMALAFTAMASSAADFRQKSHRKDKTKLEYQGNFDWFFMLGLQQGGDVLQSVIEVDTNDTIDNLEAGALFNLQIGAIIPVFNSPFSIQSSVGFLYDRIYGNVNNATLSFRRQFVEVIPFFNWGRYRFGLGANYHFRNRLSFSIPGNADGAIFFDETLGAILQLDIVATPQIILGIRYTRIEYEEESFSSEPVSGSALGAHIIYHF